MLCCGVVVFDVSYFKLDFPNSNPAAEVKLGNYSFSVKMLLEKTVVKETSVGPFSKDFAFRALFWPFQKFQK